MTQPPDPSFDPRFRETIKKIYSLKRAIPDWPVEGVTFQDFNPVYADPAGLSAVNFVIHTRLSYVLQTAPPKQNFEEVTKALAPEARGFTLGYQVASMTGLGFIPVRKPNKLPPPVHTTRYQLEYGENELAMAQDAISPGEHFVVIDDVLATGGTAAAAASLGMAAGGHLVATIFLCELAFLGGREKLEADFDKPVIAILQIP